MSIDGALTADVAGKSIEAGTNGTVLLVPLKVIVIGEPVTWSIWTFWFPPAT
jgi:hypothetical protein